MRKHKLCINGRPYPNKFYARINVHKVEKFIGWVKSSPHDRSFSEQKADFQLFCCLHHQRCHPFRRIFQTLSGSSRASRHYQRCHPFSTIIIFLIILLLYYCFFKSRGSFSTSLLPQSPTLPSFLTHLLNSESVRSYSVGPENIQKDSNKRP
jgi:hypothetical protein